VGSREAMGKPRNIQERTFAFAVRIVNLHRFVAKQDAAGRSLGGQVLRSGTSIGANLEEATAGQSHADFVAKCGIALKEARETQYWLRLLAACDMVPAAQIAPLLAEAAEIVAILTTIVRNAREDTTDSASPLNGQRKPAHGKTQQRHSKP
jgi:four helix bundle protein